MEYYGIEEDYFTINNLKHDNKYSFASYIMISTIIGFYPTMVGFGLALEYMSPLLLICSLFIQTLVLFPDKLDKVLPVNFKKWTGGTLLLLLTIPNIFIALKLGMVIFQ